MPRVTKHVSMTKDAKNRGHYHCVHARGIRPRVRFVHNDGRTLPLQRGYELCNPETMNPHTIYRCLSLLVVLSTACGSYRSSEEPTDAGRRESDGQTLDASPPLPKTASVQFTYRDMAYPKPCSLLPWSYAIDSALLPQVPWPGMPDAGALDAGNMRALLINDGQLPVAYHARRSWSSGSRYVPGVAKDGSSEEKVGTIFPGETADITAVFGGGVFVLIGSTRPFREGAEVEPLAGEGSIDWPKRDFYGSKTDRLYVATLGVTLPPPSCLAPFSVF
jgi:hypothetical protein